MKVSEGVDKISKETPHCEIKLVSCACDRGSYRLSRPSSNLSFLHGGKATMLATISISSLPPKLFDFSANEDAVN